MAVKKLKGLGWVHVCTETFPNGSLDDHTTYLLQHFMPMKLYPSTIKRVTASTDP